jgi:4-amino-4-deoxy-L-arabinose transferase-like glycosyltransferase
MAGEPAGTAQALAGRRTQWLTLALWLLAVLSLLLSFSQVWGEPYQNGWLGRNGARYSMAARNLQRWPLSVTGGVPCLQSGALDKEGPLPYARHPPGFTWLLVGSFAIFGEHENSARVVPMLATLLLAIVVGVWAARRGTALSGALAAATFCLLPMTLLYGGHIDVQSSPTALCVILGMILWERWSRQDRPRSRGAVVFASLVLWAATGLDWPGYLALAVLALREVQRRRWRAACWLGGLGILSFALFLGWVAATPHGGLDRLFAALTERSLDLGQLTQRAAPLATLGQWLRRFFDLYPWWVGLVVAVGVWRLRERGFIAGLAAVGVLHLGLFPVGALLHDYWSYLLAAPLALALGLIVGHLPALQSRTSWQLGLLGLALATLFGGQFWLRNRLAAQREALHPVLAATIRQHTDASDRLVTNGDYNPVQGQRLSHPALSYYADRKIRGRVATLELLRWAEQEIRPSHFLQLPAVLGAMDQGLLRYLSEQPAGRIQDLGNGVTLVRLP